MVIIDLFVEYATYVIPAIFGVLVLFALVNWLTNPYRKQNGKIERCRKKIVSYPENINKYVTLLPAEYQRQWRAYQNTAAERPSLVFEFVRRKNTLHLLRLWLLTAIMLAAYAVAFVFYGGWEYVVCQVVFYVAFDLIVLINYFIYNRYEKTARKVFARFVADLNSVASKSCKEIADNFTKTVKEINELNKGEVTKGTLNKASEILHNKGLENNRTAQEQRKLNTALNGLLQAYSRNAKA